MLVTTFLIGILPLISDRNAQVLRIPSIIQETCTILADNLAILAIPLTPEDVMLHADLIEDIHLTAGDIKNAKNPISRI